MKSKKKQPDHEHSMIRSELETIRSAVNRLKSKMEGEGNVEAWVQSKITRAADYLDAAADYIESGEHNVHGSMDEENKKGLWANIHSRRKKGLPRKKPGQKGYPETLDIEEGLKQARKNVGASKCWTGKKIDPKNPTKIKNGREVPNCIPEENESINEATRLHSQSGNVVSVILTWRGKYYSLKIFFPKLKMPSRQEINDELQKVYPGCKVVSHSVSEFNQGDPLIQPFGLNGGSIAKPGPNKNYVKPMSEDWQKVNRQDKTDGLSQKAVDAYRRENPGSKLQTAVTEKNPSGKRAERRKSFCSRSAGQRDMHNIDCSETPDKPICKARRRWKC